VRTSLAVLVFVLSACSPAAPKATSAAEAGAASKSADSETGTPSSPFFGTWKLSSAKVAPWWDEKGATPAADQQMDTIMFGADKSSGPPILTCDKPKYAVSITAPRGLFEGSLKDANATAKMLGFNIADDITTMNFSCASDANDVEVDFPMVDDNTIMLGLDNMLYTFKRSK